MTDVLDRPNADTELDFSVLEALDFAPRCEATRHGKADYAHMHDDGPATHYALLSCPSCSHMVEGLRCEKFVGFWKDLSDVGMQCTNCGSIALTKEWFKCLEKI